MRGRCNIKLNCNKSVSFFNFFTDGTRRNAKYCQFFVTSIFVKHEVCVTVVTCCNTVVTKLFHFLISLPMGLVVMQNIASCSCRVYSSRTANWLKVIRIKIRITRLVHAIRCTSSRVLKAVYRGTRVDVQIR